MRSSSSRLFSACCGERMYSDSSTSICSCRSSTCWLISKGGSAIRRAYFTGTSSAAMKNTKANMVPSHALPLCHCTEGRASEPDRASHERVSTSAAAITKPPAWFCRSNAARNCLGSGRRWLSRYHAIATSKAHEANRYFHQSPGRSLVNRMPSTTTPAIISQSALQRSTDRYIIIACTRRTNDCNAGSIVLINFASVTVVGGASSQLH